jgi:transcriptional regulator with XRE-family HTH domain
MTFEEDLQEQLDNDPEFRREWEAGRQAFEVIRTLVGARARLGWTQTDLAKRMGTTQANVSRAENTGKVTPEFMARFAEAVGGSAKLQVKVPGVKQLLIDISALEKTRRLAKPQVLLQTAPTKSPRRPRQTKRSNAKVTA